MASAKKDALRMFLAMQRFASKIDALFGVGKWSLSYDTDEGHNIDLERRLTKPFSTASTVVTCCFEFDDHRREPRAYSCYFSGSVTFGQIIQNVDGYYWSTLEETGAFVDSCRFALNVANAIHKFGVERATFAGAVNAIIAESKERCIDSLPGLLAFTRSLTDKQIASLEAKHCEVFG